MDLPFGLCWESFFFWRTRNCCAANLRKSTTTTTTSTTTPQKMIQVILFSFPFFFLLPVKLCAPFWYVAYILGRYSWEAGVPFWRYYIWITPLFHLILVVGTSKLQFSFTKLQWCAAAGNIRTCNWEPVCNCTKDVYTEYQAREVQRNEEQELSLCHMMQSKESGSSAMNLEVIFCSKVTMKFNKKEYFGWFFPSLSRFKYYIMDDHTWKRYAHYNHFLRLCLVGGATWT